MCNCKPKVKVDLSRRATNAAMCHLCPHGVRRRVPGEPWITEVYQCSVGGAVPTVSFAGRCPKGRHDSGNGKVRWMRTLWWGVPCPLRIRLFVGTGCVKKPWDLPGCGCSVWLKEKAPQLAVLFGWCGTRIRGSK